MPRYLPIRAEHEWNWQGAPVSNPSSLTVYEPEADAVPTGLVDASGTPIYRVQDRVKLGFCLTGT